MIVRGQRVFLQEISGVVLDCGNGQATVELDDGRVLVVVERDLVLAESSAAARLRAGTP